MSNSDILSVAGIAVSVVFGIWGLYLALRRAKYPASLTFVREQTVALLDDFGAKIPNLSVLYKDTPVEKSVVLLSGYVVNDGSLDITKEMTEQPLTCLLPDGCDWLEFKVTTSAPALHVSGNVVDKRNASVDFGLFRRGESFSFQALALLGEKQTKKKVSDFSDEIVWTHRIASLGAVKTIQMPLQSKTTKRQRWIIRFMTIGMFAFYGFFGVSQVTGLGPVGKQPSIVHLLVKDGHQSTIRLVPNKDGTTTVKDLDSGKDLEVDLATYVKSANFVPMRTEKRTDYWLAILSGIVTLFGAASFLFFGFRTDFRRYRLRKLVAASIRAT